MNKWKRQWHQMIRSPVMTLCVILIMASVIVFIVYPLFQVVKTSFLQKDGSLSIDAYERILSGGQLLSALTNSLQLALIVSVLATVIAYLFAYMFAYYKVPLKPLFNGIAILPVISPPFVIALSAILIFGRHGIVTKQLLGMENANIYGLHGLVLVKTLSFFPV